MVPIRNEWKRFKDAEEQLYYYRRWGLIPEKGERLRPIMVTDGYLGIPEPCEVVGYVDLERAVIKLADGYHAIWGEYLADLQPKAYQKLPYGWCFADVLRNYIVLDIETTGFSFHSDSIIEIAAVSYHYREKGTVFHTLVNPKQGLSPDTIALTGIQQEDVDKAPALEDVTKDFLSFIGDAPIVGHNATTFDIPFLSEKIGRIGNIVIDTLPMARSVFKDFPTHKLTYLKDMLELSQGNSHRALDDVETTNALLWACLAPRRYETKVIYAILNRSKRKEPAQSLNRTKRSSASEKPKQSFKKIDIKSFSPSMKGVQSDSPFYGKNVVFTGELTMPRETAMQMAVDAGAILKSSVSSKTHYLIVGKQDKTIVGDDGMSGKEEKANQINQIGKVHIEIINEEQFMSLLQRGGVLV